MAERELNLIEKRTPMPMPPKAVTESAEVGGSGEDVIRGSSNIPLDQAGEAQSWMLAKRLKGKLDKIYSSDLLRSQQSADALALTNPKAGEVHLLRGLRPWCLGGLEGQPTLKVLADIAKFAERYPDRVVPGRGRLSTCDGESFNQFRQRALSCISDLIDEYKDSREDGEDLVIAAVTHYRDVRLLKAWFDEKMPVDLSVDPKKVTMKEAADGTSSVHHIYQDAKTHLWCLDDLDINHPDLKVDQLESGVYFIRHGSTAWNSQS